MADKGREPSGYGLCTLAMIPVRAHPSDKAELSSQLLFGENYELFESRGGWTRIISGFDKYEGWIDEKQVFLIDEKAFRSLGSNFGVAHEVIFPVDCINPCASFMIPMGSSLPGIQDHRFRIGKQPYEYKGAYLPDGEKLGRDGLIDLAVKYLHAPYLWGGRTPLGLDCSGFTQVVYKLAGYQLPRDAIMQAGTGASVNFLSEAAPGDLAFFDNDEGQIVHVGILIDSHMILHASGMVRIDKIDHHGIFNEEAGRYTHKLRIIKKMFVD